MGFLEKFKHVEVEFMKAIQEFGTTTQASKQEDMYDHWDVNLNTKFDVKAIKKTNRYDENPNENIHWVELVNVNGQKGWLFGRANYFSFETDDYWVIVGKKELQKFIADKCKTKEKSDNPELYKLYNRNGRKDIITLVKTIDLVYIADLMIKKIKEK